VSAVRHDVLGSVAVPAAAVPGGNVRDLDLQRRRAATTRATALVEAWAAAEQVAEAPEWVWEVAEGRE
jgi:hypothetical protein